MDKYGYNASDMFGLLAGSYIDEVNNINDNFWKWFGNSKILDDNGNPLVVYHTTDYEFDVFDTKEIGTGHGASFGNGFYFSNKSFPNFGKNNFACYLRMENPFVIKNVYNRKDTIDFLTFIGVNEDDINSWLHYYSNDGKATISRILREENINMSDVLSSKGCDGLIVYDTIGGFGNNKVKIEREYVVFEPNQIKSVDNNGQWSLSNSNIYK